MTDLATIQRRLPIRKIEIKDELAIFACLCYADGKPFEQKCVCVDLDRCTATVWVDNFSHCGGLRKITIPADMKIGIEFKDKVYF